MRPEPAADRNAASEVMMATQMIAPCLWFDGCAEEAAAFYVSLFPNSRIHRVINSPIDTPGASSGSPLLVEFSIAGQRYQALNGGPHDPFNDAISLSVSRPNQAEVDRLWEALTAGGGKPIQCGWPSTVFPGRSCRSRSST
jgi:predicted 3-demethylubiquinone-9 3-methyltransferase (glyoxalase superfamily)